MFALYNTLDDDDSDIRSLGANAVSTILGKSMVPQAATKALAEYMLGLDIKGFPAYVACRMTGTTIDQLDIGLVAVKLEPATAQFERASVGDNKLFTEEKQNLWIDEVQDASIWCEIFRKLPLDAFGNDTPDTPSNSFMRNLLDWATESTALLNNAVRRDESIGWASKPEVFAFLFRTCKCINTILDYHHVYALGASDKNATLLQDLETKSVNPSWSGELIKINNSFGEFLEAAVDSTLHPVLVSLLLGRNSLSAEFKRANDPAIGGKLTLIKTSSIRLQ